MTAEKFYSILPKSFHEYQVEEALKFLVQDFKNQENMLRINDEQIRELTEQAGVLKRENEKLRANLHAQELTTYLKVALAIKEG